MPAAEYNLVIEQGTDWEQKLRWKDSNKDPIDLTDYTARMYIKRNYDTDVKIVELTTENGRITLGGLTGEILLSLPSSITEELCFGEGVYDLELIDSNGKVKRLLQGKVSLSREATRNGGGG